MRAAKQSDSPSGYDRDVYPNRRLKRALGYLRHEERTIRRREREQMWTRFDAVLSCRLEDAVEDTDFPGCVW